MASNVIGGFWSVKITSLAQDVTVNDLAQTFNIPPSRIRIPRVQQYTTYYAFINDFTNEQVAREFAYQWSGSSVFGKRIKCDALPPKDNDFPDVLPDLTTLDLSTKPELLKKPITSEEKTYYEECKQYYRLTAMPVVSISDEILNSNTKLESVFFKFVIDEDYNKFNMENFLSEISNLLNIDRNDIDIKTIQTGSVILELEFMKKFNCANKIIKMKAIYHAITDKLREEMGKFKILLMFMGDLVSFTKMQKFRSEIKLHPQWNRAYGMGHTHWTGTLNDGRDRGPHPYYCPIGWKRYALYVTDIYDDKFKGWSFCYHGTKFSFGLSILLSGLKPATAIAHGAGIYASPSIIYSAHPRYSEIKEIAASEQTGFFQGGKYVQFMLQCRVHPSNIKVIGRETLGVGNAIIDSNVNNSIIEWVIDRKGKSVVDFNDTDAAIICTGIMIRVTDKHPGLLPQSQWWFTSHLCKSENCCALGIDLNTLKTQKANGEQCNLIFN
ncbi:hypothetical protein I4U23_011715 [Adineta vaga]|nr:hypothetical protein I4U23_011715 [Adineta vaga]